MVSLFSQVLAGVRQGAACNRQEQTGTDRNRQEQTGTDRGRQEQTGTDRNRQEQKGTYMGHTEAGRNGNFLVVEYWRKIGVARYLRVCYQRGHPV